VWTASIANATVLVQGLGMTAWSAGIGFAFSALVGIALGVALTSTVLVERAFYPFSVFLQTVPLIAIAPLLVVWFGYGWRPVAAAAFIASVFPVVASTVAGLRSTDRELLDLVRLYGGGPLSTLLKLRLPWALPSIFTGLRVASGLAVVGAIVGEFVASYTGGTLPLGALVTTYVRSFRTDLVFSVVVLASVLGLVMFGVVGLASWLTLRRWYAGA
jgi:NitT/TauT family transport system permease protein